MKRSLLVAALSLAFASTAMAAGQDVGGQTAILVQQQQQTTLLQSIDAKLGATATTPNVQAVTNADREEMFRSLGVPSKNLIEKSRLARLTIDIYSQKDGKDVLGNKMVVTTSSLSPSHAFAGTTMPYRAEASNRLDKDGKPLPPVIKTLDVGTALNIVPLSMGKDQVVLSLGISQSRLLSMASFEANGLTIDLPSTQVLDQTQGITLKVGQSTTFMGQDGRIVVHLDSVDAPAAGVTQVSSR